MVSYFKVPCDRISSPLAPCTSASWALLAQGQELHKCDVTLPSELRTLPVTGSKVKGLEEEVLSYA